MRIPRPTILVGNSSGVDVASYAGEDLSSSLKREQLRSARDPEDRIPMAAYVCLRKPKQKPYVGGVEALGR
jgi:hypothetical protein